MFFCVHKYCFPFECNESEKCDNVIRSVVSIEWKNNVGNDCSVVL